MTDLEHRLALSKRLLECAEDATSILHQDALRTTAHTIQSGGLVPQDILSIVIDVLSFKQDRFGH